MDIRVRAGDVPPPAKPNTPGRDRQRTHTTNTSARTCLTFEADVRQTLRLPANIAKIEGQCRLAGSGALIALSDHCRLPPGLEVEALGTASSLRIRAGKQQHKLLVRYPFVFACAQHNRRSRNKWHQCLFVACVHGWCNRNRRNRSLVAACVLHGQGSRSVLPWLCLRQHLCSRRGPANCFCHLGRREHALLIPRFYVDTCC